MESMRTASAPSRTRSLRDPSPFRPAAVEILRLVWQTSEISRAEIARRLGFSRSTVSTNVRKLLEAGWISQGDLAPSNGGRRAIGLRFEYEAHCILGFEVGATHVSAVLTDLRGRMIAREHRHHPVQSDPEGTRALMTEIGRACLDRREDSSMDLLGIGVGVPGPVDLERPDLLSRAVLPRWDGHNGFAEAFAPFEVPLAVENDANLGALAEAWSTEHEEADVVFVKVATGVGSGRFVGGSLDRGATNEAGEIAHLVIDPHGIPCACGRRGCLTTRLGRPAMFGLAERLLQEHPDSVLRDRELTIEALVEAARNDDPVGRRVCDDAAAALGAAIEMLIDLTNPEAVVLGGGIAQLVERLLGPIRARIEGRSLSGADVSTTLRVSGYGPDAVPIGAATMVLRRVLDGRWAHVVA